MMGIMIMCGMYVAIKNKLSSAVKKIFTPRVAGGSVIAFIGYILSPASWWNDLFVNIPIAYVSASIASMLNPDFFAPAFVTSYLLTNVLGFILMHTGAEIAIKGKPKLTWITLLKYALVSVIYTVIVVILIKLNIIKPLVFNY